jgi:hypothetical protein
VSRKGKLIRRGPLKGKRVSFAPADRIEDYAALAREFMARVFDLEPGDYLLSDESEVNDFTGFGEWDAAATWQRIEEIFGVGGADVGSERLVDLLAAIAERRRVQ